MVEIKDKIVTVESLSALHNYNKETFKTKEDASHDILSIEYKLATKFDKPENDIVPIVNGGTSASNGADGIKNLFAAGATVLSSHQYGDTLPAAGTAGRIFFKKLSE